MICGTALCYSTLDLSGKWLVALLPVVQVVWLRFFVHAVLGIVVLTPFYGRRLLVVHNLRLQLLRGSMLATMTGLNFWALRYLTLDVTGAIQFALPILVALASARWLNERLDARRWCAILVGFVGVLVVVRPGSSAFHPAVFLSIGNVILYAAFNMLTRRLAATDLPATTQLWSATIAALLLAPFGIAAWQTPADTLSWLLVLSMGVFGGLGHLLSAQAHRLASAAVLAPFMYQQMVYFVLGGWLIFGDLPSWLVLLGSAMIIGSGLYLMLREFRTPAPPARAA